jgi:molybdate/tungstate transport system substrate-binding protein
MKEYWSRKVTGREGRYGQQMLIACVGVVLTCAAANGWAAGQVDVLYAGSLVNLMEHGIGPANEKANGDTFRGYAAGSNGLANEIKGQLRRGDVFISAVPKVNASLTGASNGNWVTWYVTFAESPVVIGYNASSRFAADFKSKPWYQVLAEPGIKLGRTDPKLDPKGALTLTLMQRAEDFYHSPGLAQRVLGAADNPAQVLPEPTLVGRLQSGELDAGFFYSTETSTSHIAAVNLPAEIAPKAEYTVTILRDAPDPAAADRFVVFLLGAPGRAVMQAHGLALRAPELAGAANDAPADVRAMIHAK